jgi:hypothetical protein
MKAEERDSKKGHNSHESKPVKKTLKKKSTMKPTN